MASLDTDKFHWQTCFVPTVTNRQGVFCACVPVCVSLFPNSTYPVEVLLTDTSLRRIHLDALSILGSHKGIFMAGVATIPEYATSGECMAWDVIHTSSKVNTRSYYLIRSQFNVKCF